MSKIKISHLIIMGDSLSDEGTMDKRYLLGIPMSGLSGLGDTSPYGRFTNGYAWSDYLSAVICEQQLIQNQKKKGESATEIADDVINKTYQLEKKLNGDFNLDNNTYVNFKDQDFVRNYSEGGLTSHDYSGRMTANLKADVTEGILSTLDGKRQLLLQDDRARGVTQQHKDESLIIEWSGANDLITVNTHPTIEEANKAIDARIENIKQLIANGYTKYVLFNLPDLSLTPRYQRLSKEEQQNAHRVTEYFNKKLSEEVQKLQKQNPNHILDVFDANKTFTKAYNDPEKFHLEKAKLHTPFKESPDFQVNKSHAPGYLFWDDVHPTAVVHAILGEKFYKQFSKKYQFTPSHENLVTVFKEHYGQKLENDLRGCLGFFYSSRIDYLSTELSLCNILKHALYNKGNRTREIICELGWINNSGELLSDNLALVAAMKDAKKEHDDELAQSCFHQMFSWADNLF